MVEGFFFLFGKNAKWDITYVQVKYATIIAQRVEWVNGNIVSSLKWITITMVIQGWMSEIKDAYYNPSSNHLKKISVITKN